ncbi:hypothetical protein LSAT2_032010 [Lamellibrachia satsuma]|nr:hypothetical protein LSAT2_032010 [Lamellibrachia satsuma]
MHVLLYSLLSQRQSGVIDCGLYAIAAATSVCYEEFPSGEYDQAAMRGHLRTCIERGVMTHFPSSMRSADTCAHLSHDCEKDD